MATGGTSLAQESTWEGNSQSVAGLEEIVVTSRRREENLMKVPEAITAFSADQIDNLRLTVVDDFLALTPNVKIVEEQDAATNSIFIRGIGSNRNQASAIAFVTDGVILPDSDAFTTDISDAERVEVLKGPQGALYGKGALAGAINITTRAPTNDFRVDSKVGYGSGNAASVYGAVAGPLVEDKLLARASVKYLHSDGTLINQVDDKGLDHNEFVKTTGRIIAKPNNELTFDLIGSYYGQNAGSPPYTPVNLIGPPGTGTGGIIDSTVANTPIAYNQPDVSKRRIYDAALTASHQAPHGTFTSITAYDDIEFSMSNDLDQTRLPLATAAQTRNTQAWSQELRFTSPGDARLRYIVGGYYQQTKRFLDTSATIDLCLVGVGGGCQPAPLAPSGRILPLHLAQNWNYDRQAAGFGQFSYDITRQLELTAALRYDRDARRQSDALLARDDRKTFGDWQPKASLAYKPSSETMFYATYSEGYKTGLFNVFNAVGGNKPLVVKPEITKNIEIGTKDSFLDRRVLVSASAFHTTYDNAQEYSLDIQSGGQATINVRRSRLLGFEVEAAARPIASLDLNASYGYTHSKIQDFNGTSAYVGQSLPQSPKYTLNLGGQYTYKISPDMNLRGRIDYSRYGKTVYQDFQNPNPNQFLVALPYETVNAQVSLTRGAWTLTAYGKNVLNEHHVNTAFSRYISTLILGGIGDLVAPAPGAIFGGELRVIF
jgi:iron complex outermembrane receptor protein